MLFDSLCYSTPDPAAPGISAGDLKDLGWGEFLICLRAVTTVFYLFCVPCALIGSIGEPEEYSTLS